MQEKKLKSFGRQNYNHIYSTKSKFGGIPTPLVNIETPSHRQIIQNFYGKNLGKNQAQHL